jgi:hypothetical protein
LSDGYGDFLRGLEKVEIETGLHVISHNLSRKAAKAA